MIDQNEQTRKVTHPTNSRIYAMCAKAESKFSKQLHTTLIAGSELDNRRHNILTHFHLLAAQQCRPED